MSWTKAVVTGASSGIGDSTARQLAAHGTHVVLVARTQERLEALATDLGGPERATVVVADLADHADVERVAHLIATDEEIDLVVNNAGFGVHGVMAESDGAEQLSMVEVMVRCLTLLSQAAAVTMAPRGRGGILNISSVGGFTPAATFAVYGASKAYVNSFTQALHAELAPVGVQVTCVAPGFTRTEFQDRANYDASGTPDFMWQSADEVARIALKSLEKNKVLVVPGIQNKVIVGALRPLARWLQRRITRAASG